MGLSKWTWCIFFIGWCGLANAQSASEMLSEAVGSELNINRCPQDAGTIMFGEFDGQSNSVDFFDTIFLCFQDQFTIIHDRNADFCNDPDPFTIPGIGYAFYECPPSVQGTTSTDIFDDVCIVKDPPPLVGAFYSYTDQVSGDANFRNGGYVQQTFGGGNPWQLYFAPHTLDDFATNTVQESVAGNDGVINVSTDQAFTVVYLNEVQIINKQTGVNGNALAGSFDVTGGLPEFDNSNYANIGIFKKSNPAIQGSISNDEISHNGSIDFTVPEMGTYVIFIEDDHSCGTSMEIEFQQKNDIVTFNVGSSNDIPGGNECLSICVENFTEINAMTFSISFDPNVLTYQSLTGINLLELSAGGSFNFNNIDNGVIILSWNDPSIVGQTLSDGECLFDICFDISPEAIPGTCTGVNISEAGIDFEILQNDPDDVTNIFELGIESNAGEICIDPTSDFQVHHNSCNSIPGGLTGSINFTVFGGSGTYSYNLMGGFFPINGSGVLAGQNSFIGNLAPGTYVLVVNDGVNPPINTQIVLDGDELAIDLTGVDPSCFNLQNGSVTAAVTGGQAFGDGSYDYEWSNLIFDIEMISQLPSGNYGVTVTDATGCKASAYEYIGKNPIDIEFDVVQLPTCNTSNDGIVIATASGGTPIGTDEYRFQWGSPNNQFDQSNFSQNLQVTSGVVSLRITDGLLPTGCQWEETFVLDYQTELNAVFDFQSELLCFDDGNADLFIYGEFEDGRDFRVGDYTTDPIAFPLKGPDHVRDMNLGPGAYDISMTDMATGCVIDTFIVISPPTPLSADFSGSLDCTLPDGGMVEITMSGGTEDFTTAWPDGGTDSIRNDLAAGNYEVTVTDGNGCTETVEVILDSGASISISSFIVDGIGCSGNDSGAISVTLDGAGNTDVSYSWDGPGAPFPDAASISSLGVGEYFLTVTDNATGCSDIDSAEVVEAVPFTIDVIPTLPRCFEESDGSLAISGSGIPGATYSYVWDHPNNSNTEILTGISAGTYSVKIQQDGGCEKDTMITLDDQVAFTTDISNIVPPLCFDSDDAQATITVSGGKVDNGDYGFLWSSTEGTFLGANSTMTAVGLQGGTQFVVVFDQECTQELFFDVPVPDSIALNNDLTSLVNASCFGLSDGTATIEAIGGTPGYTYSWPTSGAAGPMIDQLAAGNHTFQIEDANGCIRTDSVLIFEPDSLIAQIDGINTQNLGCSNDEDGTIFVEVLGGNINMPYTFQWTNDISSSSIAGSLGPGQYFITVTDALGCTDVTEYTMTAPPPVIADIPDPDEPVCFGDKTCISIPNVSGGAGPEYRFSINDGPLFSVDDCVEVFAGVYDIQVFDNSGCSYDTSLIINQPEELILDLGPDIEIDLGDSTTVVELVLEGPNIITDLNWEPNSDFDCINSECDRILIYPSVSTLYQVSVEDAMGCTAYDELFVSVNKTVRVFFPNVFSPNGDGFNDIFNLFTGKGIVSVDEFRVYDRWGNQMYEAFNITPNSGGTDGWDGRFKNTQVDIGVYTYFAKVTLLDRDQVNVRGDVTLVR